jgi:hypothetical protein
MTTANQMNPEIYRLRTRLIALVSCINRLSIHSGTMEKYDDRISSRIYTDVQSAVDALRSEGVIADSVGLLEIGMTIYEMEDSDDQLAYETTYRMLEKALVAYRLVKNHLKDTTHKLIEACNLDSEDKISEILESAELETSRQRRYAVHVNNASWDLPDLDDMKVRIFNTYKFMLLTHTSRIPELSDSGGRDYENNWHPHLQGRLFMENSSVIDNMEFCTKMKSIVLIVDSIEYEVRDMLDGMRAWKMMQCAMSLHSRLGADSGLGLLGQDLVRTIAKFVLE